MLACCIGSGLVSGKRIGKGSFGSVDELIGVERDRILYLFNDRIVLKEGACIQHGTNRFEDVACLSYYPGAVVPTRGSKTLRGSGAQDHASSEKRRTRQGCTVHL